MATIKKLKKAENGNGIPPKGMVRGERSEGKLYKKADADKWGKGMSDALDKQAGLGKYAPKKAVKAKDGGNFGMLSVKAGVDKNPKVTFADKIAGAKGMAKSGKKVTKGCMSCGGKMKKK